MIWGQSANTFTLDGSRSSCTQGSYTARPPIAHTVVRRAAGRALRQNRPCPSSRLPIGLTRTQTALCRRRHRCHPRNAPSPLPFPQGPKKDERVAPELLPPHPAAPWEASPAPQPPRRRRWWSGQPPPGPRSPSRPKRSTKGDRALPAEPPPLPERERAVGPKRGTTCAGRTAATCTQRFRVGAVAPPPALFQHPITTPPHIRASRSLIILPPGPAAAILRPGGSSASSHQRRGPEP